MPSLQPGKPTKVSHSYCFSLCNIFLTSQPLPFASSSCVWTTAGVSYILFLLSVFYSSQSSLYWRRQWHPTPVLLPGKSHGRRSLVGCSPWDPEESGTTERLHFHFSLSCTGEGNGNPLQYSCLENPRDREAWWAAVYGVVQTWARLKRLSSSSSSRHLAHLHLFIVR